MTQMKPPPENPGRFRQICEWLFQSWFNLLHWPCLVVWVKPIKPNKRFI